MILTNWLQIKDCQDYPQSYKLVNFILFLS